MHDAKICEQERCREIKPRPEWGPGPWQDEPDRVDFRWYNLDCFLHRNQMGGWCGYVGVPRKHPAFGHDYNEVPVSVHGGLTYADKCWGHLCHAGPGARWWLGFDCGHSMDLLPGMEANMKIIRAKFPELSEKPAGFMDVYRDVAYVTKETKHLAEQLARFRGHQLESRRSQGWRGNARDPERQRARSLRAMERWRREREVADKARG